MLQAAPGASPVGGADQLLGRTPRQSLEGAEAEAGVGLADLLEGMAEDAAAAGSLIFRAVRGCWNQRMQDKVCTAVD